METTKMNTAALAVAKAALEKTEYKTFGELCTAMYDGVVGTSSSITFSASMCEGLGDETYYTYEFEIDDVKFELSYGAGETERFRAVVKMCENNFYLEL